MMKLALRLCALWVCGPLALGASANESAAQGASSKAGHPVVHAVTAPHAVGSLARNTADRLRPLHPAKARGGVAPASMLGPDRAAATGTMAARAQGLRGATRAGLPAPPVSKNAAIRGPIIGGPHAAGPGQVGGPPVGRTVRNTAIDGAHMRRKF
jgi:hypothetical protein